MTSVEVTLLDLGAVVRPIVVEQALDVALRRELTTLPRVRATLERLGKRGRDGTATLRAILDERAPRSNHTESPAETAMVRMLRRNGMPTPVLQYVVVERGIYLGRVDAAYPEHKIAIEYESYEHHTGKLALVRDSARRNGFVDGRLDLLRRHRRRPAGRRHCLRLDSRRAPVIRPRLREPMPEFATPSTQFRREGEAGKVV